MGWGVWGGVGKRDGGRWGVGFGHLFIGDGRGCGGEWGKCRGEVFLVIWRLGVDGRWEKCYNVSLRGGLGLFGAGAEGGEVQQQKEGREDMKRGLTRCVLMGAAVLMGAIELVAQVATCTVDGVTYTYSVDAKGNATLVEPTLDDSLSPGVYAGPITIPRELDGHLLTGIGECAFFDCGDLESVVIPEGVTSIGDCAFAYCTSLTNVVIPESVVDIGLFVFSDTAFLDEAEGDALVVNGWLLGVTEEGKSKSEIVIPDGVTRIGEGAFYQCTNLVSVAIPDGVTSIGRSAFESCTNLVSVVIPESVASIGGYAFSDTALLNCAAEDVVVVDGWVLGVSEVGRGKRAIEIPGTAKGIADFAFGCCMNLESVVIPKSVGKIADYAFSDCTNLTEVTIAEGVKSIGDCAFVGCENLKKIDLPDSVTKIGSGAFDRTGLDGVLKGWLFEVPEGDKDKSEIVISGEVTRIADGVFSECKNLESVVIPDSVTGIADGAFSGCTTLKKVTIPQVVCTKGLRKVFLDSYGSITQVVINAGVTNIGEFAFDNCTSLDSVVIPDGVTSIGDCAFDGCTGLESVVIPNSVTSIGEDAFRYCESLKEVAVPQVVCDRGIRNVFSSSYGSITQVVINAGVTSIGDEAFGGCMSLESVVIPNGVTSIGDEAFGSCTNLVSVVIPDGVTSIGNWAFYGCTGLESVVIPNSVTSIGDSVFNRCTSLKRVVVPQVVCDRGIRNVFSDSSSSITQVVICAGVTSIGDEEFEGCMSLESVVIPDSVTRIGENAFSDCPNARVVISDGVTSVGADTFSGCTSLGAIVIPNSVTSIADGAFEGCTGLKDVTVPQVICDQGMMNVFSDSSSLITQVVINAGVTRIKEKAFENCTSLESLVIPNSVTSIEENAFTGCTGLKDVTIPQVVCDGKTRGMFWTGTIRDVFPGSYGSITQVVINAGVTNIGKNAFIYCGNLQSVVIPDSVTSIGDSAFYGCENLESIVIPDSVMSIGDYAFCGCTSLGSIVISDSVTSIGKDVVVSTALLKNAAGDFLIVDGWVLALTEEGRGKSEIVIPDEVKGIADGVFAECTNLKSVEVSQVVCDGKIQDVFPDSYCSITQIVIRSGVTSIGENAFEGCTNLESVVIPNSVTSIGENAFSGTALLDHVEGDLVIVGGWVLEVTEAGRGKSEIVIPDEVRGIADGVFADCASLESVVIPNSVTSIGNGVFSGCTGLKEVAVPQVVCDGTITNVFSGAYSSITQVVINAGVTRIGDEAFEGCTNLVSVAIPDSVTSIGKWAFYDCESLESVVIPNSVTNIGYRAFMWCTSLESVVIPDRVTSIEKDVFEYCTSLESVVIPNSVTNIGSGAFVYCENLKDVTIPQEVCDRWIQNVFPSSYGSITQVVINAGVTSIGDDAFRGCTSLESVVIPDSVTRIGETAFEDCTGLRDVTVPQVVCDRGIANVFSGSCSSITQVVISDGVTSIGEDAFEGCTGLRDVTVPQVVCDGKMKDVFPGSYRSITQVVINAGVTNISAMVFEGCESLVDVTIPESVTSIGYGAFNGTAYLKNAAGDVLVVNGWLLGLTDEGAGKNKVKISEGVTNIVDGALAGGVLQEIEVAEGNEVYCAVDGVLFSKDGTKLIVYPCKKAGGYEVPEDVELIEDYAFSNCEGLTSVVIPESVAEFGVGVFSGAGVKNIYFMGEPPENVEGADYPTDVTLYYFKENEEAWLAQEESIGRTIKQVTNLITYENLKGVANVNPGFYEDGSAFEFVALTNVEGSVFAGWSPAGITSDMTGPQTVRANWTASLTYENLKGAANVNPANYTEGGVLSFAAPGAVTGYTFAGWTPAGITSDMSGPQTVRADWTANSYTIKYDANGGEGEMEDTVCMYDQVGNVVGNGFTRRGYSFRGWATEKGGEVVYESGDVISNLVSEANGSITFYAAWEAIYSSITYENLKGAVNGNPATYHEGTVVNFAVPGAVTGYTFAGWEPKAITVDMTGAQTVRANWTANNYSIKYDANGGEGEMESTVCTYDQEGQVAKNGFTRRGYSFRGWATEKGGAVVYEAGAAVLNWLSKANAEVTLYAVWGRYELAPEGDGAADLSAAQVYNGCLYDEDFELDGTIQVKAAKQKTNKKTGVTTSKVTATIQIMGEAKKVSVKGEMDVAEGTFVGTAKDGRVLELVLGKNGMRGSFDGYTIDGARDLASSKDKAEKSAAESIINAQKAKGVITMAWEDEDGWNGLSLTIGNKGKTKVAGKLADGTKVSVSVSLIIGEEWCVVPVVYSKNGARLAFNVWITRDGSSFEVDGLDEEKIGMVSGIKSGAAFTLDSAALLGLMGEGVYEKYLPEGVAITVNGTKWVLPKAGKVSMKKGVIDESKAGENPAGLKLSYKAKDGSFSGSFKVYANVNGKLKATSVSVSGFVVNGVGYGMATIKKVGSVAVGVE